MKMIIRAVGKSTDGSKGDVLAELELKNEVQQSDLDFLRAKLELTFAELYSQEVVARYEFEELAPGPGLVFQPRSSAKFHIPPNEDGVQHVVVGPTGEAKSMLGKLLQAERMAAPDLSEVDASLKEKAKPDFSSDAFNKQAEKEISRSGLIGPRDRS